MQQNSSLNDPLKASRRLSEGYGGQKDVAQSACEGFNPYRTASDFPAASFNLRLSEILPGPLEDFGRFSQGGLQIDA